MSDKPILFSAPMVRALLAGTKTQTRRPLRPQPYEHFGRWQIVDRISGDCHLDLWARGDVGCRPVMPRDRLWVREHWRTAGWLNDTAPRDLPRNAPIRYEADPVDADNLPLADGRFRPSMFMLRWASRITLTVTDVRVERLQDISEADALAEGIVPVPSREGGVVRYSGIGAKFGLAQHTATLAFLHLWDSINGEDASALNPWVAAYTYTVEIGNIDAQAPEITKWGGP